VIWLALAACVSSPTLASSDAVVGELGVRVLGQADGRVEVVLSQANPPVFDGQRSYPRAYLVEVGDFALWDGQQEHAPQDGDGCLSGRLELPATGSRRQRGDLCFGTTGTELRVRHGGIETAVPLSLTERPIASVWDLSDTVQTAEQAWEASAIRATQEVGSGKDPATTWALGAGTPVERAHLAAELAFQAGEEVRIACRPGDWVSTAWAQAADCWIQVRRSDWVDIGGTDPAHTGWIAAQRWGIRGELQGAERKMRSLRFDHASLGTAPWVVRLERGADWTGVVQRVGELGLSRAEVQRVAAGGPIKLNYRVQDPSRPSPQWYDLEVATADATEVTLAIGSWMPGPIASADLALQPAMDSLYALSERAWREHGAGFAPPLFVWRELKTPSQTCVQEGVLAPWREDRGEPLIAWVKDSPGCASFRPKRLP